MVRLLEVFAVFCCAVTLLVSGRTAPISCKNDYGSDVTWFFMYKLPGTAEYLYVESAPKHLDPTSTPPPKTSAPYWTLSPRKITDRKSALGRTVLPLSAPGRYPNVYYALYNDQVQKSEYQYKNGRRPSQTNGHTKGILMYDNKKVVWIIHSVPTFPTNTRYKKYEYPESGLAKGQTVFCVTFRRDQLKKIVADLWYQLPYFYPIMTPRELRGHVYLFNLLKEENIESDGRVRISELIDVDGHRYFSFAKPNNYVEDVYSGVVAPTLQSHLMVSTWRNGKGTKVPRHINDGRIVDNIEELTFNLGEEEPVVVKNTVDHSKWAISYSPLLRYVCVGTLNRMEPQYKRGGHTLCFRNEQLHKLLWTSITSLEEYSGTDE